MEHDCRAMKANGLPLLADRTIAPSYAILFSRWPLYGSGKRQYALGIGDGDSPAADQDGLFTAELRKTIALLQSYGIERVMVIGPTPFFPRPTPDCLYLADRYGMNRADTCGVDRASADAYRASAVARIDAAISGIEGVRYVDPFADFCDAGHCLPFADDTIFYIDTNHLSDAGMDRIIAGHTADFGWLVGGSPAKE
jgi:hypothetical protein